MKKIIEWFKQRRVWAALLSAGALFGSIAGVPYVVEICAFVAGSLSLDSYIAPKKK